MAINLDTRKKQLHSFSHYLSASKTKIFAILNQIRWNEKRLFEHSPLTIDCCFDPSHALALRNVEKHEQACYLQTNGYKEHEPLLSEPASVPSTSSIALDYRKKLEVLTAARWKDPLFRAVWNGGTVDPMTSDRLLTSLSPAERLAIYDYCVKNTEAPTLPPELDMYVPLQVQKLIFYRFSEDHRETKKNFTSEELRMRDRDLRRRRIKYKSVHTNRKSHKEIMRQVIENHMEIYKDWLKNKPDENIAAESTDKVSNAKCNDEPPTKILESEEERPNSRISRHSNQSSSHSYRHPRSRYEYDKHDDRYRNRDYSYKQRNRYDERRSDNDRRRGRSSEKSRYSMRDNSEDNARQDRSRSRRR